MAKFTFTPGPDNKLQVEVSGFPGANCVKATQGFAGRMQAAVGEPDLLPEYYDLEATQDLQQETQ